MCVREQFGSHGDLNRPDPAERADRKRSVVEEGREAADAGRTAARECVLVVTCSLTAACTRTNVV